MRGPKTIVTTAHHLFWDETTRTWTDATDLKIDDQLAAPGGGRIAVQAIHRYSAANRTYNLTVDSVHTYYVMAGNTPVLVHNAGGDPLKPGQAYLWRAVTGPELTDITNNRVWNSPQGVKYFSFTEQGASECALLTRRRGRTR